MRDKDTQKCTSNCSNSPKKSLEECVDYFKNRKGFQRLFSGVRDKYVSLGYMGGSIKLSNLSLEEKNALTGFLKKDFMHQKSAVIRISDFETAINETRFNGVSLQDIVEEYFHESLFTKKEEINKQQSQWDEYFSDFLKTPNEAPAPGTSWLQQVLDEKIPPYRLILRIYNEDKQRLNRELKTILSALSNLPVFSDKTERLAVFAAQISGNPHYLDQGSEADRLLTYGICYILNIPYPSDLSAERKAEILYEAGLLKDEISNFSVCYGLEAMTREGEVHKGFLEFKKLQEPLQISLANLSGISDIKAENHVVYVVENPVVFAGILDSLSKEIKSSLSLVCTNGQPRLASIVLLDLLVKNNTVIYYSGDFDPEGLLIADRLKIRYGDFLEFWRFDEQDFTLAKSKKTISPSRLSKLKKVVSADLKKIAACLEIDQRAGFQENILDLYIQDISKSILITNAVK